MTSCQPNSSGLFLKLVVKKRRAVVVVVVVVGGGGGGAKLQTPVGRFHVGRREQWCLALKPAAGRPFIQVRKSPTGAELGFSRAGIVSVCVLCWRGVVGNGVMKFWRF